MKISLVQEVQDIIDEDVLSSEIASTSGVVMLTYEKMLNTLVGLLEDENKVDDTFSQMSGVSETGSQMEDSNLHPLRDINDFLDKHLDEW